jgi:hypothetical protein
MKTVTNLCFQQDIVNVLTNYANINCSLRSLVSRSVSKLVRIMAVQFCFIPRNTYDIAEQAVNFGK